MKSKISHHFNVSFHHLRIITFLALCAVNPVVAEQAVQNPTARAGVSLDGNWDVIIDPYENGFYNHRYQESSTGYFRNAKPATPEDLVEYNFENSPKLNVPGDWNTQDDKLFWYEGTIWYHRDIELSIDQQHQYVLYFGAINYKAIAYVNGKKVGAHEGGFTPFQFDISSLVKNGSNSIVIKVDNRRERDQVPTVNTDWWNYGGITRSVRVLVLPKNHIDDYEVRLANHKNNEIAGYVHVVTETVDSTKQVSLRIPALNINKQLQIEKDGSARFSISAKPSLWSPEHPNLYAVELQYGEDKLTDEIGFRNVEVRGEDILLNGKSVFLKGISIHEESPLHPGRAWSDEDAEQLLSWAKDLGCNFVRLAHYPHNEAMLRAADRMGLMVWSEIPVYWTVLFDNATVYDKAELQLREMIARDKNRASVMLWSVANETPKSPERLNFLTKLIATARSLDNSRLITAALDTQSDDHGAKLIDDPLASQVDVIGINTYCGWYSGKPDTCPSLKWISRYHKPAIVSEFGADALQGMHGDKQQRFTEEYQANVYKQNLLMLDQMTFLRGLSPWILKDFRSPRRPLPGIQDYWNRKGLISDKGIKKQAWYVLQSYYEKKR